MKTKLLYFLFFLSFFSQVYGKEKHYLSICSIFQNEAKYLSEWIDFHKKQGVEHFYLYNNLSKDNFNEVLKPYIKKGLVTLIEWPYESTGQDFFTIQCNSYMDCVMNFKDESTWIAFLDTDEFLFCPDGYSLINFLNEHKEYGCVFAYWRMYGTSNISIPKNGKLTDYLVYRAKDEFHGNKIGKTISQSKYIQNIENPHVVSLKNNKSNYISEINKLRINHYWSRDSDFFYNVKLPRRAKWYGDVPMHIQWEKEMNEVYDPILSHTSS